MRLLHSEKAATSKLMQLCPFPMHLAWHENRTSFFSCRKERGKIHLRLHRLFLGAPTPVLEAVMKVVLKGDRRSGRIVRQMAHFYFSEHRAPPDALKEKGAIYDLAKIRDQIQKDYFPFQNTVPIGWSKQSRIGSFRCMTFGSYDQHRHQIRIHPCLDDAEVPLYFIEFIVYHELLHAVHPPKLDAKGRVRSHPPEFRRLERKFAAFEAAKMWEKQSLQFFRKRILYGRA